jgi:phospholipid/cholesterol/gamma-HCH transport system permease protein
MECIVPEVAAAQATASIFEANELTHSATKDHSPNWQLRRSVGRSVLAVGGDWIAQSGRIPEFSTSDLRVGRAGDLLVFDTVSLGKWDTGFVVFLWDVKRAAANADLAVDDSALPDAARKLLDLLPDQLSEPQKLLRRGFQPFNWLGGKTIGVFSELGAVSQLLAGTAKGGLRAIVAKALIRAVDLIANTRAAGPSALVIVSVVNFLIGAILAFVGAVQLRRFAADIFVANMVGLAVVREMAAVMTAIVMAGRTGGAYAARIATMRGNEELDALEVVGIPLSDYLILPSVLALVFAMPLLYLYGCLVGMFGGFVVSISMLNITSLGYLHQTLDAVPIDQFIFGFIKTIAFAVMIGLISCRIGLTAGRSAADVGVAATRAVVAGIVGVITMDAMFAVAADVIGI